jgi:hypothetical protein
VSDATPNPYLAALREIEQAPADRTGERDAREREREDCGNCGLCEDCLIRSAYEHGYQEGVRAAPSAPVTPPEPSGTTPEDDLIDFGPMHDTAQAISDVSGTLIRLAGEIDQAQRILEKTWDALADRAAQSSRPRGGRDAAPAVPEAELVEADRAVRRRSPESCPECAALRMRAGLARLSRGRTP